MQNMPLGLQITWEISLLPPHCLVFNLVLPVSAVLSLEFLCSSLCIGHVFLFFSQQKVLVRNLIRHLVSSSESASFFGSFLLSPVTFRVSPHGENTYFIKGLRLFLAYAVQLVFIQAAESTGNNSQGGNGLNNLATANLPLPLCSFIIIIPNPC